MANRIAERVADGLWRLRKVARVPAARRAAYGLFEAVYRDGRVYPIVAGPLRGLRWRYRKGQQLWMPLGLYERETTAWIERAVPEGGVFYDVGANEGYFTLLGARLVGERGKVVAFEPVPELQEAIGGQLRLNGLASRVLVRPEALSDASGEARFVVEARGANSHLADIDIGHAASRPERVVQVPVRPLDGLIAEGLPVPDALKVDVEGGEVRLLRGAERTLREHRPRLLVATHGEELRRRCAELLEDFGYRVEHLPGFEHELVGVPA